MSAEQLLSSVPNTDAIIVADLEAGIGTLTRLPDASVDTTLVVVEPTPRSIDVAKRAVLAATDRQQGSVTVIANKVADAEDADRIRHEFVDQTVFVVPHDVTVIDADRQGRSAVDLQPESPAVLALRSIAHQLADA